jgi:hypothetical protein
MVTLLLAYGAGLLLAWFMFFDGSLRGDPASLFQAVMVAILCVFGAVMAIERNARSNESSL